MHRAVALLCLAIWLALAVAPRGLLHGFPAWPEPAAQILTLAAISTAISLPLGAALAISPLDQPGLRWPLLVLAAGLLFLPRLWIPHALGTAGDRAAFGTVTTGVLAAHLAFGIPIVMLVFSAFLQAMRRVLVEAALCGARPLQAFRAGLWPLLVLPVVFAAAMAFTASVDRVLFATPQAAPGSATLVGWSAAADSAEPA